MKRKAGQEPSALAALSNTVSNAFYSKHYHTIKSTLCLPGLLCCNWEVGAKEIAYPTQFFKASFSTSKEIMGTHIVWLYFCYLLTEKIHHKSLSEFCRVSKIWYFTNHFIYSCETSLICSTGKTCYMFVFSDLLAE